MRDQDTFNCLLVEKFGGAFSPSQFYTAPIFRCRCVSLFTHCLRCVVYLLSSFVFSLVFIFVTAVVMPSCRMLETVFCQNQNLKFLYRVTRARCSNLICALGSKVHHAAFTWSLTLSFEQTIGIHISEILWLVYRLQPTGRQNFRILLVEYRKKTWPYTFGHMTLLQWFDKYKYWDLTLWPF